MPLQQALDTRYIIVFDGVCNFCNGAVNFIIARDPRVKFAFTPMQSEYGQKLIDRFQITNVGFDTFLLIKENSCYVWTDAAIEIAKDLSGFWFLTSIFKVIPRPIRDFLYRAFARNRYTLFGKRSVCIVPSDDVKGRFLGI